jgi:hypothetical protein
VPDTVVGPVPPPDSHPAHEAVRGLGENLTLGLFIVVFGVLGFTVLGELLAGVLRQWVR